MRKLRYIIIVAIFFIDQIVKHAIRDNMYVGESIPLIDKVFSITYIQNRGAAFSLFSGTGQMLTVLTVISLIIAVIVMEKRRQAHWTMFTALSLIIAGGLGNLFDRLSMGFVTDMFDLHFWPVFNVADIAICVGCGFLVLYMFAFEEKK